MASLNTLTGTIIMILILVAVGALVINIVSDIGEQINNTRAKQATEKGLDAIEVIFNWLRLLVIVILAGVVLYLLLGIVIPAATGKKKRE
jgi:chromate transport protein ChrA